MTIKIKIFSDGERYPVLFTESGVPDFWPSWYVTTYLRLSHTYTSIESFLRSIVHLQKWQLVTGRDLFKEIERGRLPGFDEAMSIKMHCSLTAKSVDLQIKATSKPSKNVKSGDIYIINRSLETVSSDYQMRRMHDAVSYIFAVAYEICRHKGNSRELTEELERSKKNFEAHYPKIKSKSERSPLAEPSEFDEFLALAHPDCPDNKVKSHNTRLRNYVFLSLLYWTGARSSEVLALRLSDIDYDKNSPAIKITRLHDDPHDSRPAQPTAKTLGRSIPIPPSLLTKIDEYIRFVRPKYSKSKEHPYLLVSQKGVNEGAPLSISGSKKIVEVLRAINPEVFQKIKRHGFRAYFHERLSDNIDETNAALNMKISEAQLKGDSRLVSELKKSLISHEQELDIRAQLCGYADKKSCAPYLERHTRRKAQEIQLRMMQFQSDKVRNGEV